LLPAHWKKTAINGILPSGKSWRTCERVTSGPDCATLKSIAIKEIRSMKHLWVGILLLGLAMPVLADMTIVEKVHTDPVMGQPASDSDNTIYAKGNKARMNLNVPGAQAFVVYDLDAKKFWVVSDAKKEVTVGSIDQMLQLTGMMSGG